MFLPEPAPVSGHTLELGTGFPLGSTTMSKLNMNLSLIENHVGDGTLFLPEPAPVSGHTVELGTGFPLGSTTMSKLNMNLSLIDYDCGDKKM